MRFAKLALIGLICVALLAALIWALLPKPVLVDVAQVWRGPMEVTVAAEGITRVRDPWTLTAPIAGNLMRAALQVGDVVVGGKTVVAVIQPAAPGLLDARSRAQAKAAITEAEAAVQVAEVDLARMAASADYAQQQLADHRKLAFDGTVSQHVLENSQNLAADATRALQAAQLTVEMRRASLRRVQALLGEPDPAAADPSLRVQLYAPQDGTVLTIARIDARLVQAGEPLLTIGNLNQLQIETDLLSADAVRVQPGAAARIERWGADNPLMAHVMRIDPIGFTKTSALGIEEQRVRVTLDLDSLPKDGVRLGDQYRVFVRIVVWSGADVLQLPQSALFRHGADWAVYRVINGRAVVTPVKIGQSQDQSVEVQSGVQAGETIITYPGASVVDGVKVAVIQ